ncbi:MAG TPA: 4-(cytidine 5'-diphospho)-2-C-methyl-D-erythritol kinase [Hanamia sp.]|nr:4-(cytidine 5'-diphospho)-2-C-methyl-D-erythritol kinase [Hanamia sp.]
MITFPNCKINLGLNILQKRADGYHNIETVFFPLPLTDILEIIPSEDKTQLVTTGISSGRNEDNLCLKAYHLIKKDFPYLPELNIHLHKVIPIGAGLGGGSSDASFTLSLLNNIFDLQLSPFRLFGYASELGSDCSFFLFNKPCVATGRGESMEVIKLSLSDYKILLINPGILINTKEIFQQIIPAIPTKKIKDIILQPVETWKNELVNDFEKIVFAKYDSIKKIKEKLYEHQAVYASMTGTGSTVFGIFRANEDINYPVEKEYFHKWVNLQ